jgi:4-diphosphocytidyl-2-C-methyl-D-erythritol kinase
MQIWPAPAKLNLFLHVTGRRRDGYHSLQTVFQFLDFGDELIFAVTRDSDIAQMAPLPGIAPADDLSVTAARLLQSACGVTHGVKITLTKRIPIAAGLGGASSDAATTLMALNRLWNINLNIDALAELALKLGADVPVFVRGRAAWAEGVGESLTPIDLDESWFVVLVPPVKVSTAEIFADFASTMVKNGVDVHAVRPDQHMPGLETRSAEQSALSRDLQLTPYSPAITIRAFRDGCATRNDLELLVRRRYPEVDGLVRWLSEFGAARMTGSGGGVFVKVESAAHGRDILVQAPAGHSGFVARGVNSHPLGAE